MEAGRYCLARTWCPGQAVSRLHLVATGLAPAGFVQQGLFEPPADKARAVARLKHEVHARQGQFTLPPDDVYRDEAHSFDVRDIHGKTCSRGAPGSRPWPCPSAPVALIEGFWSGMTKGWSGLT